MDLEIFNYDVAIQYAKKDPDEFIIKQKVIHELKAAIRQTMIEINDQRLYGPKLHMNVWLQVCLCKGRMEIEKNPFLYRLKEIDRKIQKAPDKMILVGWKANTTA